MRMCEAFAAAGHDVRLIAKRNDEPLARGHDLHTYYGVRPSFAIDRIARPKWRHGGEIVFAAGMAARVARYGRGADLVYARDLVGAVVAAELGLPVVYEVHGVFQGDLQRRLWRRMVRGRRFLGLVAISRAMVGELDAEGLLPTETKIVVAHSPANAISDAAPRAIVASPPRIGYVGSLYPGRGVELVVEVAARMPHRVFEIIGGSDDDLERWRATKLPANVVLRGFVAPGKLAALYRELDVLLLPYPRSGIHGPTERRDTARYCSPMKMFEYMASGVAMVASDLPVLQEVIAHEKNALIAAAGDADSWCATIERLIAEPTLRVALARQALADLEMYTPQARTAKIFSELGLDHRRGAAHRSFSASSGASK